MNGEAEREVFAVAKARSENGGLFIFRLQIEIAGRDCADKSVRATPC